MTRPTGVGALKYGAQYTVTEEAMEDSFSYALERLGRRLVHECRPDWDTVRIEVFSGVVPATWIVRLSCEGGGRACVARGATL